MPSVGKHRKRNVKGTFMQKMLRIMTPKGFTAKGFRIAVANVKKILLPFFVK